MGEDHAVSRRRFVEGTGLTTLATLAGCTGGDAEDSTPTSGGETDTGTTGSTPGSTPDATNPPEGNEGTPTEVEGETKDVPRNYTGEIVDNPVLRPIENPEDLWSNHLMIARVPYVEYVSDDEVKFDWTESGRDIAEKWGWATSAKSHSSDDWALQKLAGNSFVKGMNQTYEDPAFWALRSGSAEGPVYGDLRSHTVSLNRDTAVDEFDINAETLKGLLEGGSGSVETEGRKILFQDEMSKYGRKFPIVAGMLDGQSQVVAAVEVPTEGRSDTALSSKWGGSFPEDGGENARDYVDVQLSILGGQVDPMKSSKHLETAANLVDQAAQSEEYGVPITTRLEPAGGYLVVTAPTITGENNGAVQYSITPSGETNTMAATSEGGSKPSVWHSNEYSA
jgi:hypothetical protein